MLSEEQAARLLEADPQSPTGAVWKNRKTKKTFGYLTTDGRYWRQKINGTQFAVHRLLWICEKGRIPDGYTVDHKDRDGLNNNLKNLRLASSVQQLQNRRAWSAVNYKGVSKVKNYEKYAAYLMYPERGRVHLGYYSIAEHAAIAHDIAAYVIFNDSAYYPLNFKEGYWLNEDTAISKKVLEKLEVFFEKAV